MSQIEHDTAAVKRAVDGYSDALNHREWDKVQAFFLPAATWRTVNNNLFVFEGAANIADGLRGIVDPMTMLVQLPVATVVEIDGDEAAARSSVQEIGKYAGGSFFCLGSYGDRLKRDGDRWRFAARSFTTFYWEENSLGGTAFRWGGARDGD